MPIYEFQCMRCKTIREIRGKISTPDADFMVCNNCGGTIQVHKKVMSLCSFQLKGSGWAKEGYSKCKE